MEPRGLQSVSHPKPRGERLPAARVVGPGFSVARLPICIFSFLLPLLNPALAHRTLLRKYARWNSLCAVDTAVMNLSLVGRREGTRTQALRL